MITPTPNTIMDSHDGGAARYGATYGRASPPRKQAERSNQGASGAVSMAAEHPASAMRRGRDGQQRRPQSENLFKSLGSNCIQEPQPTSIRSPVDHQVEGRTQ